MNTMRINLIKLALAFACLLLFSLLAINAGAQCRGNYQKLLHESDTVVVPCADMVLMNMPTFETYYLSSKQLTDLREQIPMYQQMRDSLQTALLANSRDYQRIINEQQSAIQLEAMSKADAVQTALRLEAEKRRAHREIKTWKIATAIAGGLLITNLLVN